MKNIFESILDRAIEFLCLSVLCGLLWLLVKWLFF